MAETEGGHLVFIPWINYDRVIRRDGPAYYQLLLCLSQPVIDGTILVATTLSSGGHATPSSTLARCYSTVP